MAGQKSEGGKLWTGIMLNETLEAAGDNIFMTKIDERKNTGLEDRASENYLAKLISRKEKRITSTTSRTEKGKLGLQNEGRGGGGGGRGRGRGGYSFTNFLKRLGAGPGTDAGKRGGRGPCRGIEGTEQRANVQEFKREQFDAAAAADPNEMKIEDEEKDMMDLLCDAMEEKSKVPEEPKTEKELKAEEMNNLKHIFGGTGGRRRSTVIRRPFPTTPIVSMKKSETSEPDAMDVDSGSDRNNRNLPNTGTKASSGRNARELVDYGDLEDFSF